jgi:hypothetical protein
MREINAPPTIDDPALQQALDIAMNYLECTGQASPFIPFSMSLRESSCPHGNTHDEADGLVSRIYRRSVYFLAVGVGDQDRVALASEFWPDLVEFARQTVGDVRGHDIVRKNSSSLVSYRGAINQV